MGLIFMVPTAALMLAAMMVEGATSAMTPGTSRKPQIIVAIAATIATFLVGCICDLIYLTGFRKPPVPAQSVYTTVSVSDRLILVKDRTLEDMNREGAEPFLLKRPDMIEFHRRTLYLAPDSQLDVSISARRLKPTILLLNPKPVLWKTISMSSMRGISCRCSGTACLRN